MGLSSSSSGTSSLGSSSGSNQPTVQPSVIHSTASIAKNATTSSVKSNMGCNEINTSRTSIQTRSPPATANSSVPPTGFANGNTGATSPIESQRGNIHWLRSYINIICLNIIYNNQTIKLLL